MEKSLVLIKPDAVEKNLIGKILAHYEDKGLKIIKLRMGKVSKSFAENHYYEHRSKSFYPDLIKFITRDKICALVLEGDNAVKIIREINGDTNPEKAAEGTIRKLYALNQQENCVHASDSIESAIREIELWFPDLN